MCEIYTRAIEVIAWIGSADDESDEAMERVEEIGRKTIKAGIGDLRPTDIENWFTPTTDRRLSRLRVGVEGLVEEEGLVAALVVCCPRLSEREYWSRVWVAQEISVARRVRILCGKSTRDSQFFRPHRICSLSRGQDFHGGIESRDFEILYLAPKWNR